MGVEIGGYPAVIKQFIRTKDVNIAKQEIKRILNRFTEESAYYFNDDKCKAIFGSVYRAAFSIMVHEKRGTGSKYIENITNFVKNDTKEHVSRKEVNNAISWLVYSGILGVCDVYNNGDIKDVINNRRFYFIDCGIAKCVSLYTTGSSESVKGIIAENFVYTELYRVYKKTDKVKGEVPCCSIYNNYELDFMIVDRNDKIYRIEVKSNRSNEHKSLDLYMNKGSIEEAYLVQITRGDVGSRIKSIPIYTVGCRFPYEE